VRFHPPTPVVDAFAVRWAKFRGRELSARRRWFREMEALDELPIHSLQPLLLVNLKSPIQTFRNREHAVSQNDSKQSHIRSEQLLADPLCGSPSGTACVEREHEAIG